MFKFIQMNQPTICSNFSGILLLVWIQLNMFRASSCPSSGATTAAVGASGLPLELGDSSAVGRGRSGRSDHDQQHCYHHAPTGRLQSPRPHLLTQPIAVMIRNRIPARVTTLTNGGSYGFCGVWDLYNFWWPSLRKRKQSYEYKISYEIKYEFRDPTKGPWKGPVQVRGPNA